MQRRNNVEISLRKPGNLSFLLAKLGPLPATLWWRPCAFDVLARQAGDANG
jgi:hypothetical protein